MARYRSVQPLEAMKVLEAAKSDATCPNLQTLNLGSTSKLVLQYIAMSMQLFSEKVVGTKTIGREEK